MQTGGAPITQGPCLPGAPLTHACALLPHSGGIALGADEIIKVVQHVVAAVQQLALLAAGQVLAQLRQDQGEQAGRTGAAEQ